MAASLAARMSGIDVSHFQKDINWQQVKRVGISFAFIKATEGISVSDPCFKQNWHNARRASILRGAYHFFHSQVSADVQARFFLDKLEGDIGELPAVLDIEVLDETTTERAIAGAHRWLEIVHRELKSVPIIYTGSAFWRTTLRNSTQFSRYPLWIAHYTTGPHPALPTAWQDWTFWQFSQQGKVAGITTSVDLDVFNGSAAELEAFCVNPLVTVNEGVPA